MKFMWGDLDYPWHDPENPFDAPWWWPVSWLLVKMASGLLRLASFGHRSHGPVVDEAMIERADVWLLERFLGAPPLHSSEVAEMLRAACEVSDVE